MLKSALSCLFLVLNLILVPISSANVYPQKEELLVDECKRDFSSGCAKKLAEVRFDYAKRLFAYLVKTDNLDSLELPLAYAESAVELAPENSQYWSLLGEFYGLLPQDEFQVMAEGAFLKAIKLDKSNNSARLLLAEQMFRTGRFSAAAKYLLDVFERENSMVTQNLTEILALSYLLDNNAQAGLETFRKLNKKHKQPFIDAFIEVFEGAV